MQLKLYICTRNAVTGSKEYCYKGQKIMYFQSIIKIKLEKYSIHNESNIKRANYVVFAQLFLDS